MNRYPIWKYAIIALAFLVSAIYAMPNLFGEVHAVDVSGEMVARARAALFVLRKNHSRLWRLQAIAESFEGVERSFAVQAGREVRILVRPEEIDDLTATRLARDIVRKIEEQLTYPGQIKVTVIRETRAVEYAK